MAASSKRSKLSVQSPRSRLGKPHFLKDFLQATDEVDSPAVQQAAVKEQVDSAARETLSERLWKENAGLAEAAWNTQYIQGIAFGTLDPNDYGHYTVQDAAYCHASTENLKLLQAQNQWLNNFFKGQYESYKDYTQELYDQWCLKNSNIYMFWIDENCSYHSAKEVEAVVNVCSGLGLIDQQKARQIYRDCPPVVKSSCLSLQKVSKGVHRNIPSPPSKDY
ncbi:uncharacterized protein [Branchiostoma lanceolatum]|uniref:uncharacterized protein n=1 Tax=Branchiostoma lanceolatum TaxID=7740 RepID=UPI0034553FA0